MTEKTMVILQIEFVDRQAHLSAYKGCFDICHYYIPPGIVTLCHSLYKNRPVRLGEYSTLEEALTNLDQAYKNALHYSVKEPYEGLLEWCELQPKHQPTQAELIRHEEWLAYQKVLESNGDNLYFDTHEIQMKHYQLNGQLERKRHDTPSKLSIVPNPIVYLPEWRETA